MGFGVIAVLKQIAPFVIYLGTVFVMMLAFVGRSKLALLCLVFLLPLRNVVEKLHAYPLGNQIMDLLIFSILVGWFVSTFSNRAKLMEKSSLNKISIILMGYLFFSLLRGSVYLSSYNMFAISDPRAQVWKNFCLLPILFFLTANTVRDKKSVWQIVAVMCAAMALMGYYTTGQISSFSSLLSRAKISGTFQFLGPNEVAAFYNQYTVILLSIYFFMKKSREKTLLFFLILLNLYCVMFMYSRAAYLAVWVGMFILFAVKNKKLLIPLVLAAVFWQVALPEKARQRIESTVTEDNVLEASAERRIQIWEKAIGLFQENFLVGVGLGVFSQLGFDLGDTHNIYVKILVEQGIVGLILFLILITCFIKEGLRLYKLADDDLSKGLGLGLVVCMVVLMINNIFGNRWTYLELSGYLWVFAGLVVRLRVISQERRSPVKPVKKKTPKLNNPYIRPV
jgi:O-antigen ligase